MAYTSVKVKEYNISAYRNGGGNGSGSGSRRLIYIESPTPVSGQPLDHVHLYFVHDPVNLGVIDAPAGPVDSAIYAYLPMEDYNDFYHILQTEKPVYIHWRYKETPDPEKFNVTGIIIGAEEERTGEGFKDWSA